MRIGHFEGLAPVCPACRAAGSGHPLALSTIDAERNGDIREGVLACGGCGGEYPILDGLPILVPDLRRYVQDNLFYLTTRGDWRGTAAERVLGDAAGPGGGLDATRQHLSTYGWDHWCDLDRATPSPPVPGAARPGGVARILAEGLDAAGETPPGPVLDLGCGAGRSTADLAGRTGRLTLGVDISFPLARLARRALTERRAEFEIRRVGMSFERRAFDLPLDPESCARADVWICDALALPFGPERFSLCAALNLIDCMSDPVAALREIARVLADDAPALLATPFDWSGAVTPSPNWLGGHSDRGPFAGRAEPVLAMLLGDGPHALGTLAASGPPREIDWHVRLHDRSAMHYAVHLSVARKRAGRVDLK